MYFFTYLTRPLRKFLFSTLLVGLLCSLIQAASPVNLAAVLDFDGDGKTDYVVVRSEIPSGNSFKLVWYIKGSQRGEYGQQWGLDGWYLVPADYDGDGKWDIGVWRQSSPQAYFYILRSSDNTFQWIAWGRGDLFDDPLQTQDFDGDGRADPTVVRCVVASGESYWYTLTSRTGEVRVAHFGFCGDRQLRGDFDGDGKADLAVYRISTGTEQNYFIILRSLDNQLEFFPFGIGNSDRVLPADFDGDGKTDLTIVRLIDNKRWWFWRESSTGMVRAQQFGHAVANFSFDNSALGDYDGDGKTDLAVWRSSDFGVFPTHFYVDGSKDGMSVMPWGLSSLDTAPGSSLQVR